MCVVYLYKKFSSRCNHFRAKLELSTFLTPLDCQVLLCPKSMFANNLLLCLLARFAHTTLEAESCVYNASTTCFIQTTLLWAGVLWPKGKTMLISPRCVQGCLPGIANQILHRKTKSNQSWLSGHFHDASTSAHSLMKCQQ